MTISWCNRKVQQNQLNPAQSVMKERPHQHHGEGEGRNQQLMRNRLLLLPIREKSPSKKANPLPF